MNQQRCNIDENRKDAQDTVVEWMAALVGGDLVLFLTLIMTVFVSVNSKYKIVLVSNK